MSDVAVLDRTVVRETRVPSHGRGRIVTTPIWTKENYPRHSRAIHCIRHHKPPLFTAVKTWEAIAKMLTRAELESFAVVRVLQGRPPRGIDYCEHCGRRNGAASVALALDGRWCCSANCAGTLLAALLAQARKELATIIVNEPGKKA